MGLNLECMEFDYWQSCLCLEEYMCTKMTLNSSFSCMDFDIEVVVKTPWFCYYMLALYCWSWGWSNCNFLPSLNIWVDNLDLAVPILPSSPHVPASLEKNISIDWNMVLQPKDVEWLCFLDMLTMISWPALFQLRWQLKSFLHLVLETPLLIVTKLSNCIYPAQ